MSKADGKVEALIAKHPNLSKDEAIKIIADKNERKNNRRLEKSARDNGKRAKNEANRPTETIEDDEDFE